MTMAKSAPAWAASLHSWMVSLVAPVPLSLLLDFVRSAQKLDSRSSHNRDILQARLIQSLSSGLDQRHSLLVGQVMGFTHGTANDGPDVGLCESDNMTGKGRDVWRAETISVDDFVT